MKLLAEKLYDARLARERVPADYLPLFDHLLNLAINDAERDNPQSAGRMIAKARELSTYSNPAIRRDEWWYGNRKNRFPSHAFEYLKGPA